MTPQWRDRIACSGGWLVFVHQSETWRYINVNNDGDARWLNEVHHIQLTYGPIPPIPDHLGKW